MQQQIQQLDWDTISDQLNDHGYALINNVLTDTECDGLVHQYDDNQLYRKTISMERYRFGLGEYKYFNYPLPPVIQQLRESVYPHLAPVANNWMRVLNIAQQFPASHTEL